MRVAVTGGIGAGKSAVSAILKARGAWLIDYDGLAREVVEPGTEGLRAIVEAFGPEVLTDAGALDRPAMAARVFADREARRRLEGIVQPLVRARVAEIEALAPPAAIVVHDVPLLAESGSRDGFDVVVVVDAPDDVRVRRLMDGRGMSEADVRARMAVQADRATLLKFADVVVLNDGHSDELHQSVLALWHRLQAGELRRPDGPGPGEA